MTSTDSLPEAETVPGRAAGYTRPGDAWMPNTEMLPWRGTSAGGGYSTVGDLLRFAQALNSGKLISKAMLAEATRPQQEQYGYGFGVQGEGVAELRSQRRIPRDERRAPGVPAAWLRGGRLSNLARRPSSPLPRAFVDRMPID